MAVLGRVLFSSAERVDLSDMLSLDSYSAGDWRYFIQSLVGSSTPYVLSGFDIIDPQNAIGTQSCSIKVADSVVYYPGSSAGPFYHGLSEGSIGAEPLVPELRKNAVNYVYLTLSTFNTSTDTRAFWDPDRNGGAGGEFTQEVDTESVIQAQVNVSTGSFPANTIPIAIITVGALTISAIEDARNLLFRLGAGGINPNPHQNFNFRSLPTSTYARQEPSTVMTSPSDPNPFQGADKNIYTLKEWMDVVMTKLKELGGTTFWYEDTSTFSITSIFHDALTTTFKSKGTYVHSSSTPGNLTWSEDITIKSVSDPRDVIIRNGNVTLNNEQVAYLSLIRQQPINALDEAVTWTYNTNYINTPDGSIGYFASLNKGDWVRKISDGNHLFLQVLEFYDSTNLGGSTTTAANARSVRLSGLYQGSSSTDRGRYDKGIYQYTDVIIQDRSNAAITSIGGNFSWLAQRSDTIQNVSSLTSKNVTGTLSEANGVTAKITATAHGLNDGERIRVTAPVAQAGLYTVEVQDSNTFYIATTNTTTGAFTGYYGLATTTTRNNGYGIQLESANHGFESGETVIVAGTTNYNGSHVVAVRSSTQFQFALTSAPASESSGTATLARMDVRTEKGITKIVQGETVAIGEKDSENIQMFIGMSSLAETTPNYFIPSGYNALANQNNYNASASDNITSRVSKLTAMMADKAQDKTIKYLCNAAMATNNISGAAQLITFSPAGSTLTILQPGSPGNATVSLPSSGGISLNTNQSAYVQINRNSSTTPGIVVANNTEIPIDENVIVIASRLGDNSVYLWNGYEIPGSGAIDLVPAHSSLYRVDFYNPVSTTLPTGTVIVDSVTITAGQLVLFSALLSGNNQVYKAEGTGSSITGWTLWYPFDGSAAPVDGSTVIITSGAGFADQIGKFTGTAWVFNDKIRYFNGVDYWEQSNLIASTLLNNTTDNVFTVSYTQSEYMIIDYSISRGVTRETGTIHVVTDGTNVNVTTSGAYISSSGVTFSGDISGSLLRLRYTTTNSGSNATMKYMVRRWSNASGGPGSLPSYTGLLTVPVPGAGPTGAIQYNNAGTIDGNANFLIDTVDLSFNLNGLRQAVLSSAITISNNISSPTSLFTFSATSYKYAIIEYSIVRNSVYRVGRLLVANNGTITTDNDDYVETAATGVTLTADISGSNVRILYTSTNTGFSGTFKYSIRRWT